MVLSSPKFGVWNLPSGYKEQTFHQGFGIPGWRLRGGSENFFQVPRKSHSGFLESNVRLLGSEKAKTKEFMIAQNGEFLKLNRKTCCNNAMGVFFPEPNYDGLQDTLVCEAQSTEFKECSNTVNRYKLQPARHPAIPSGAVFTVVLWW